MINDHQPAPDKAFTIHYRQLQAISNFLTEPVALYALCHTPMMGEVFAGTRSETGEGVSGLDSP